MATLAGAETVRPIAAPSTVRLDSLDFLRGLCAIAVAMYHYHMWSGADVPRFLESLLAIAGTYGVSVFFILSGYSLAHAYEGKFLSAISPGDYLRYIKRRLGRLVPLFLAAIILSIAGKALSSDKSLDIFGLFGNATLLFGFVQPSNSPVIGGWSIGIEVVYYILFPILVLMSKNKWVILLCSAFFTAWITTKVADFGDLERGWSWYVHPANHLIFFAVGVYARLSQDLISWRSESLDLALVIGCVAGIALCALVGLTPFEAVTGVMRVALVLLSSILVLSMGRLKFRGALHTVSGALGGLSYPMYLFHPLLYFAFVAFSGGIDDRVVWLPLLFSLAIAGAVVADHLVDRPLQKRLKAAGW
jgi:exopolysaccharide production protein ExoZ